MFPTHEDFEHLAMIEKNSGKFPHWMVSKIRNGPMKKLFLDGIVNRDRLENIKGVEDMKSVNEIFMGQDELLDLLLRCL